MCWEVQQGTIVFTSGLGGVYIDGEGGCLWPTAGNLGAKGSGNNVCCTVETDFGTRITQLVTHRGVYKSSHRADLWVA